MTTDPDALLIETPEHVQFSYELAGLGSRFAALLIDTGVQFVVLSVLIGIVLRVAVYLQAPRTALFALVLLSFSTLLSIAYFVALEVAWRGQSVGKRLTGLRVIRATGGSVGFTEAAVRNLLRLIDWLPGFYMVGALFIFFSQRCQRVGDFAAGTLVVRERFAAPPREQARVPRSAEEQQREDRWRALLPPQEKAVLEQFMARRYELAPEARYRLAEQIAARLRGHEPGAWAGRGPEEVLEEVWRMVRG
jgi:uncharacterized RDD family membrane protein YckC